MPLTRRNINEIKDADVIWQGFTKSSFVMLVAICVFLIISSKISPKFIENTQHKINIITMPFVAGVNMVMTGALGISEEVRAIFIAKKENARLKLRLKEYKEFEHENFALASENSKLKHKLNFLNGNKQDFTEYKIATAKVVAQAGQPYYKFMIINPDKDFYGNSSGNTADDLAGDSGGDFDGDADGGADSDSNSDADSLGSPRFWQDSAVKFVRNEDGLIGIIQANKNATNSKKHLKITLISDANLHIPVKIERTGHRGILHGNNSPELLLRHLSFKAEESIKLGDRIVTSGDGSMFPVEIPIGQVFMIDKNRNKILVKPFANFHNLEYVFILY